MKESSKVRKIAFVSDHLPRMCGIATFTSDLLAAVATSHPQSECLSVAVNDIKGGYEYPEVVRFEIEEQDLFSYLRAADFLNISNVDVVCLQHEFGIFGGPAGGHILALLRELRMPVVTTLHTVLSEPRADQRRVMQELIRSRRGSWSWLSGGDRCYRRFIKRHRPRLILSPMAFLMSALSIRHISRTSSAWKAK
jgi:glycosyltransferase involved in cell wall biosynthesis